MSFGAGQHMGRSVQTNLKLKGKRKTFFDRPTEKSHATKHTSKENKRPTIAPGKLLIFRNKIQLKKRRLFLKRLVFATFLMLGLLLLFRYLNGGPL